MFFCTSSCELAMNLYVSLPKHGHSKQKCLPAIFEDPKNPISLQPSKLSTLSQPPGHHLAVLQHPEPPPGGRGIVAGSTGTWSFSYRLTESPTWRGKCGVARLQCNFRCRFLKLLLKKEIDAKIYVLSQGFLLKG